MYVMSNLIAYRTHRTPSDQYNNLQLVTVYERKII